MDKIPISLVAPFVGSLIYLIFKLSTLLLSVFVAWNVLNWKRCIAWFDWDILMFLWNDLFSSIIVFVGLAIVGIFHSCITWHANGPDWAQGYDLQFFGILEGCSLWFFPAVYYWWVVLAECSQPNHILIFNVVRFEILRRQPEIQFSFSRWLWDFCPKVKM